MWDRPVQHRELKNGGSSSTGPGGGGGSFISDGFMDKQSEKGQFGNHIKDKSRSK